MLRLCHELPRYSLDMDFWFFREMDFETYYDHLGDHVQSDFDVTDMQNKFYSILMEIRRRAGTSRLKIEIRKVLAPAGGTEEKIAFSPHFPTQVLLRGFTLREMCKSKVMALLDRGEIRDAFDLEFMVRRGVALDLDAEQREDILTRLRGFRKRDFDVKLGSVLLPEVRGYYREKKFAYLEEKLTFEKWDS